MEHDCRFETTIMEMHGDLKKLVSEIEQMNGSVVNTKKDVDKHIETSNPYRKKVDMVWAGIQVVKYIIMLLFGTGLLFQFIKAIIK